LKRCGLNNFTSELDKDIPLYITVDCDVLDLSEFQAVSFPRPGKGLRLIDILNSLKTLKKEGYNIVGIDICEYNPKMDTETYLYGRILAHFIAEVLSIIKPRGLN
jgi:arginase family enzyme